jgi:mannose/fructose/N-acetylgalactosamine-specific phosphotransferase system component IIB
MSEMERKTGSEFDEVLASALKRVDAPEGFAARLMERAASDERVSAATHGKTRILAFPRRQVWATGAIAAALIVGALTVGQVHERREQTARVEAQRMQAQKDFETASRIEDAALEHTREQLARAGVRLGD